MRACPPVRWRGSARRDCATGVGCSTCASRPTASRVASVGMDATLRVWDAATGEQLFVVRRKEGDFGRVCFAPGGKVVAAGHSPDLVADVWWVDAATGKVTGRKELAGVKVRKADPAVRFSPDGSRLAVGDWSENRFLFSRAAGAGELWAAKLGGEVPGGVGFAADGKTVAVGTAAGKVRLFDTDGKPREVLSSDAKGLTNVALSPDGSQVTAAAGDDALAWNRAPASRCGRSVRPAGYSLAYSPDGKAIVRSGYGYQAGTIDPADGLGGGVNGKPVAYSAEWWRRPAPSSAPTGRQWPSGRSAARSACSNRPAASPPRPRPTRRTRCGGCGSPPTARPSTAGRAIGSPGTWRPADRSASPARAGTTASRSRPTAD